MAIPGLTKRICVYAMSLLLSACAATPHTFSSRRHELSDTQVCNTNRKATKGQDQAFHIETIEEMSRRGLDHEQCGRLIRRQRMAIAGAVLIVAAVAAVAASSDGGGGSGAASDYSYSWDMFHNESGQMVARCRGEQTGQFAANEKCAGKAVNDLRWPGHSLY